MRSTTKPRASTSTTAGVTRKLSKTPGRDVRSSLPRLSLRAQCTTAKAGRYLKLHEHDALQREHRQRAKDSAWQQDYQQHRPMVERTIAWLVAGGNRKVRYRGITKNHAWLQNRNAAGDQEYTARHRLSGRQVAMLLAGGLLPWLRQQKEKPTT